MTTYSNISPDAYQVGGLWTRDGSQSLCADCMFMPPRLGSFCSVGAQIVPTIVCSGYAPAKLIFDEGWLCPECTAAQSEEQDNESLCATCLSRNDDLTGYCEVGEQMRPAVSCDSYGYDVTFEEEQE